VRTLWDSLSPLGLTNTAGLAEELSEAGLCQSHWAPVCLSTHIRAGSHSSPHQRRGHAHLETNAETPETDHGAWRRIEMGMGMLYPVSVFAPELSGWLSVLTLSLRSSDDDRSLAPFFPLSPLLFLVSDAAFVLKKARSSALSSSLARE
jgi:hypothetical protein